MGGRHVLVGHAGVSVVEVSVLAMHAVASTHHDVPAAPSDSGRRVTPLALRQDVSIDRAAAGMCPSAIHGEGPRYCSS